MISKHSKVVGFIYLNRNNSNYLIAETGNDIDFFVMHGGWEFILHTDGTYRYSRNGDETIDMLRVCDNMDRGLDTYELGEIVVREYAAGNICKPPYAKTVPLEPFEDDDIPF